MKTLKELAEDAAATVDSGFYRKIPSMKPLDRRSLVQSILKRSRPAIICEIKFASPSAGEIDDRHDQVSQIANEMETGGAAGLSVLTEPKSFAGSLENLAAARMSTNLPVIMKDIIVSKDQIEAAQKIGASSVLLIWELFASGYSKNNLSLEDAIAAAKSRELEVVVEAHSREGLNETARLACEIIGINNRDLKTFKTNIDTTVDLLKEVSLPGRLLMSESGFENASDISYVIEKLNHAGAPIPRAFLIGTSIMRTRDVRNKVAELAGIHLKRVVS